MPKSETWPSGPPQTMRNGMDSAGSCDSFVSANSQFSDDSLEHLSAEEKACLLFLEETIEALDTEDDSGLSNHEPDQLPCPGNLATKLADLSASMSKSNVSSSQTPASKDSRKQNIPSKSTQNFLVPTPLVMAGGSLCSTSTDKTKFALRSDKTEPNYKQKSASLPPPSKSNPSIKHMDSFRTPEGGLPRGPLSYDALVHLRRSASTKKTPLCPTVDHTIEPNKHRRVSVESLNHGYLPRSDKTHLEFPKTSPPPVAPKPKKVPPNILLKSPNEEAVTGDVSSSVKHAGDPKAVRLEALHKLGLLGDQEQEGVSLSPTETGTQQNPSHSSKNPSFFSAQVPKNKLLQSSGSFHAASSTDQQRIPVSHHPPARDLKTISPGRSASLDDHTGSENCPELKTIPKVISEKNTTATRQSPNKPSNMVGYTVMVVPGMGADRKEALRKLGLLKD